MIFLALGASCSWPWRPSSSSSPAPAKMSARSASRRTHMKRCRLRSNPSASSLICCSCKEDVVPMKSMKSSVKQPSTGGTMPRRQLGPSMEWRSRRQSSSPRPAAHWKRRFAKAGWRWEGKLQTAASWGFVRGLEKGGTGRSWKRMLGKAARSQPPRQRRAWRLWVGEPVKCTATPREASRQERWSIWFRWPCAGKGTITTTAATPSASLGPLSLSLSLSHPNASPVDRAGAQPLPAPVAVFWDLDNKPPNSVPPYDAAVRLKLAASRFGPVELAVAYANRHAFRHVPAPVRAQRRDRRTLDRLEDAGAIAPAEPHLCRVCGRRFFQRSRLVNHFRQIHEREQAKRVARIESARGGRRVRLAAELSAKMVKYRRAAPEVLVPRVGYGLAEELRRAGVVVREVPDRPDAADRALREHMVEAMDRGLLGCLVLVSDDSGFAGILREAKMRCLKTVVVGDEKREGALKRIADAGFSWQEVASGKAAKEAASVMGRWKDRELLKRLEWTYRPGEDRSEWADDDDEGGGLETGSDCAESAGSSDDDAMGFAGKTITGNWWHLESAESSNSTERNLGIHTEGGNQR